MLLDGLEDERQQGITIDVAYRYFTTPRRKFIIADTPGHEQFTRNMATGASTADLAVLVLDARKGILPQTKRHSFIVSLLGIRHLILAVNKMDLVEFDQAVFERLCDEYRQFASRLDVPDLRFVPVSALRGDNVARDSDRTPWYHGGSLLSLLETVYFGSDRNLTDFRFPVQWVNRPHLDFRGFSGTVASGVVRVGDEVLALPSRRKSRVKSIVAFDGELSEAYPPLSVTLTLEDEIDVTRGDVLVRPGNLPHVGRDFDAMLVWMSEQPLVPGRAYWLKHAGRRTSAEVETVRYRVDVNTLHRVAAASLKLNEIGRCQLRTHEPLVFDAYRRNRQTGSFILVDRVTHETVAAGMIRDPDESGGPRDHWDDAVPATKLHFAASPIAPARRAERFGAALHAAAHRSQRFRQDDARPCAGSAALRARPRRDGARRAEPPLRHQPRPGLLRRRAFGESAPGRRDRQADERRRADRAGGLRRPASRDPGPRPRTDRPRPGASRPPFRARRGLPHARHDRPLRRRRPRRDPELPRRFGPLRSPAARRYRGADAPVAGRAVRRTIARRVVRVLRGAVRRILALAPFEKQVA